MQEYELKDLLEKLYKTYSHRFSSKDPVWVLHRFQDERDIEIIGLITSAYAYGSVDQINRFIESLLSRIGNKPYEFTINFGKRKDKKFLKDLYYRFNTEHDLLNLFDSLGKAINEYGSLKNLFMLEYSNEDENIVKALQHFTAAINQYVIRRDKYFHYLLTNPAGGSTCKRMNLFLRWMVRKDEIDLGLWNGVSPAKLIMPVDTHIGRISKKLKLVERKSVDLKFAIELTRRLRRYDANDPVKYDFALCHLGIEKKTF
jgi:uncharacterized protein (TIGR02757 family)